MLGSWKAVGNKLAKYKLDLVGNKKSEGSRVAADLWTLI
jgi:hypothetical protein